MSHGWDNRKAKLDGNRKVGICKSPGYLVEDPEGFIFGLAARWLSASPPGTTWDVLPPFQNWQLSKHGG